MSDTNFHQVHEAYTCFSRSNCLFIVACARGVYSLYVGWYGCAAVFDPLFWHSGDWTRSFGGTFSHPPTPKLSFGGIRTTNSYKIQSFWSQIPFFPFSLHMATKVWFSIGSADGLIAQIHYLNQCWLLINEVVFTWEHASSLWVPKLLISLINVKNILSKLLPHLPGANELKTISMLAVLKLVYFKKSKSMSWLSAVMILTEEENMILIIHLKECQLPQCQEII